MTFEEFQQIQSRRRFLRECAGGVGTIALWKLLADDGLVAQPLDQVPATLHPKG